VLFVSGKAHIMPRLIEVIANGVPSRRPL